MSQMPQHVILIGPPGCGKGTQARILATRYGYYHLSTGQMIREGAKKGDPLVLEFMRKINEGGFAPDEFIMKLVKNVSLQHERVVFDGVPRTVAQAEYMDREIRVDKVILLELSGHDAQVRVQNRFNCETCKRTYTAPAPDRCVCGGELTQRAEDTTYERRQRRVHEYETQTRPVLEYFASKGRIVTVDASRSIEDVAQQIQVALKD